MFYSIFNLDVYEKNFWKNAAYIIYKMNLVATTKIALLIKIQIRGLETSSLLIGQKNFGGK